ncbi:SLC26A/SulP transporter family protein [Bradyrhizobium sp. HKCCYLS1011]|uniref:SLC26A/SulP transporter family protein n=1 Tax=Bradyrhizobium sp. HKCCYLS1011 TaxID=3420733 RepID=UPI003EB86036
MTSLSVDANPAPRRGFDDVFGGLAASVLTITYGLSYALLIFAGPLAPYLGQGLGITFIVSAAVAIVLALGSSLPFAIGAPESSTAAVTAILASSLVDRIVAVDPSAPVFAPVVITFGLTSIATGAILCGCGMTRLGRAIRYVPYPVVGGFLGATGALIVFGAIRVITGQRLQLASLGLFANPQTGYELAAACAMALLLYSTWHRSRNPFALPVILIAATLAAHVAFWLAGISPMDAQALGWTFQPPPHVSLVWSWNLHDLGQYPWRTLPDMSGDLIAVTFVTAASTLFNTAGIEVATHREAEIERELTVTGIANLITGALGGYTGCVSISRTILNVKAGGSGRLSGAMVAAISVLMLAFAPPLLGYMPKFVLGGLLLYLGADTLHRWAVQSRRRLSRTEYVSLLAIILIILQWGFIAGVLSGVLIGCMAFALSASRINPIKYSFDGTEYRSSLDRSRDDQALLATHGSEIQGLNLQSYLFFGSANRLYQHVKALLMRRTECRFLVFDFKLVTGIDSSAAYSFAQIKRVAQERGIKLVLVHLSPAVERALRASEFITADVSIAPELDHGLERCENAIIARHRGREQDEADLRDWFGQILGSHDEAAELMHHCERLEVAAGSTIVRAGDAASSMHFILEGRVGVMIPAEHGGTTRVRSLGRYTTIGEMGLVAHAPRSATIQAEADSVLYVLTTGQFDAITRNQPTLGQKLLIYFVTVMAERLNFANRTIAVLRR